MKPTTMDRRMRAGEVYNTLRVPPGAYAIVRVDGHGFTRFTADLYTKPFDERCHDQMVATARDLLRRLQGRYAYTESDEISILLPRTWDLFDRQVEKVVSLAAGMASAAFTHAAGEAAHFDARVWVGGRDQDVVDYFRWREADAARCALNGWSYWTLRYAGLTPGEAAAKLHGRQPAFKHDLLHEFGIHFGDLPAWQRRGTGLVWRRVDREGFDPIRNRTVVASRRQLVVESDLPIRADHDRWIHQILADST